MDVDKLMGRVRSGALSILSALLVACLCLLAPATWAEPPSPVPADKATVRIGFLAFRSVEQTAQQWRPTVEYLQTQLPSYHLEMVALHQEELTQAVIKQQVDFLLTQPEHYVLMRAQHGLAAVATLMPVVEGQPVTQFGGVIFTRADRQDINTLADLKGKTVAAVYAHSLGAYRMQQWTLLKAGVQLPDDVKLRFTGQPQDKAVFEVLEDEADVGFVRTGVIESLIREHRIAADSLKVINPQPSSVFPQRLSTDLYPEWPFSARRELPETMIKAVTLALLGIPANSEAAKAGKYYGFSPPVDYSNLEAVMLRLGVHPGRLEYFGWRDVVDKYPLAVAGSLLVLLTLLSAVLISVIRSHRRMRSVADERAILLDSIDEGIFGVGPKGECTFINPKALAMLGFQYHEIVGHNQHHLFHHHRPDGSPYPDVECPIHQTLQDGKRRLGEETFFRRDGSAFPVSFAATPMLKNGKAHGAVVAFRDITVDLLAQAEMRIAAIAFQTQEAIVITDAHSRILRVNKAFTSVTGYSPEEAIGQTPNLLKSGRHDDSFYRDMWAILVEKGNWQGEVWNRRKNGDIYPEWLTITAVYDGSGQISHFVAAFLDITQRKLAEERIEFLAYYDPLTNLPNRRLLHDTLHKALFASRRRRTHGALFFIDIDNFKTLNDTLGHDMGDLLLVEVANRLKQSVRATDCVGRLGGDEFVIILEDLSRNVHEAIAQAEHLGQNVLTELARPYPLRDREFRTTASVGITLFMERDESIEHLLKSADMAMYQAKSGGKNALRFFDPAMQTEVEERLSLENDLRQAADRDQLRLYYQPQVDAGGRLVGVEALVRWQHPQRGLLGPGAFITLAEETSLILPVGHWVLETACKQLAAWAKEPERAALTIAVNVSAMQFRHKDFTDEVRAILAITGAPPARLKLEITESLFLDDSEACIARMADLKTLGVCFSLDDFGTGYSSLTYLKRLPLDQIKIDQSFIRDIRDILDDPNDATIASTVIALGRNFGLEVIAEGVENADQQQFLLDHGCYRFQGYLFGKPAPVEALFPDR